MRELMSLNKYLVKYKWLILLGIIFVAASNYFRILIPRGLRKAVDLIVDMLGKRSELQGQALDEIDNTIKSGLMEYALLVIGAAIVTGIFMYFMRQTIIVMSRRIEYDLRKDIFNQYLTFDQSFLRKNQTGDLMARISEDVSKVRMYLGPGILYAINLSCLFFFVIKSMYQASPILTLYTLLPLPILSVSIYFVSNMIHKYSYAIQQQLSKLNSLAQEVFSGIRVVKVYAQEDALGDYFAEESEDFKQKSLKMARINAFFFPLMIFLIGLSTIVTIYMGGLLVSRGEVTTGNIAEFVLYVNMLTWPVTAIGWIASIVKQAEASQKRINEFMVYESPISLNPSDEAWELSGDIQFDQVKFNYDNQDVPALNQVDLHIESKKAVAIVGRTASGKTTIADLIFRLFDPQGGQINMDGKPLLDWPVDQLRSQMAYVPQDTFLFSDTIRNNITLGNSDINEDQLRSIAKDAAVLDDIDDFQDGFDTKIGERGVSLSGGQKQRLSIARALAQNPKILILDDSLSAVDPETEQQIIETILKIKGGLTLIFITHRLQALRNFDHIHVIDKGSISGSGSHEQLMESMPWYAKMYQIQKLELQEDI